MLMPKLTFSVLSNPLLVSDGTRSEGKEERGKGRGAATGKREATAER